MVPGRAVWLFARLITWKSRVRIPSRLLEHLENCESYLTQIPGLVIEVCASGCPIGDYIREKMGREYSTRFINSPVKDKITSDEIHVIDDPGSCQSCGGWRLSGMLHDCAKEKILLAARAKRHYQELLKDDLHEDFG